MIRRPTRFEIMRANRRVIRSVAMRHEAIQAGWDEPETPEYAALQEEIDRARLQRVQRAAEKERRRGWLSRLFNFTLGFGGNA